MNKDEAEARAYFITGNPPKRITEQSSSRLIRTNVCPTCSGSICTTCGHPTVMHIQDGDGERFCTRNTPGGCDCKADPQSLRPLGVSR